MKETNWMENERVKDWMGDFGDKDWRLFTDIIEIKDVFNNLLLIVAEEAVKEDRKKRRESVRNNLIRLIR